MNKISYIFFVGDDPEQEPLKSLLRPGEIVRIPDFAEAMLFAGNAVNALDAVHLYEDDGESIKSVLTVKKYGR